MVFWQTSPFWISIVAFFWMREAIIPLEIISMLFCFSMVVLIATQQTKTSEGEGTISDEEASEIRDNIAGLGCALFAAFVMAFCAVSSRMLKDSPTPIIIFYHTIGGFVMTSIFVLIECLVTGEGTRMTEYTGRQWAIAFAASACDMCALFSVTLAYQRDSSGFVALISYMNIVYAYICDQIFF